MATNIHNAFEQKILDCSRHQTQVQSDSATTIRHISTMSAPRAVTALTRSQRAILHRNVQSRCGVSIARIAPFTCNARHNATSEGSPPAGFRATREPTWKERKDSVWDQAGNYFMLTEMLRGMYVVLEQFFRPPYVNIAMAMHIVHHQRALTDTLPGTQSTIPLKKVQSHRGSVANTHSDDIPRAKNDASLASCAKPSARHKPSRSRPKSEQTEAEGRQDMTLT